MKTTLSQFHSSYAKNKMSVYLYCKFWVHVWKVDSFIYYSFIHLNSSLFVKILRKGKKKVLKVFHQLFFVKKFIRFIYVKNMVPNYLHVNEYRRKKNGLKMYNCLVSLYCFTFQFIMTCLMLLLLLFFVWILFYLYTNYLNLI